VADPVSKFAGLKVLIVRLMVAFLLSVYTARFFLAVDPCLMGTSGLIDPLACSPRMVRTMAITPPLGWTRYIGSIVLSMATVGAWYIADYNRKAWPSAHPVGLRSSWPVRYGVVAAAFIVFDQFLAAVGGCLGTLIDDPTGGLFCVLLLRGIRPAWPSTELLHYVPVTLLAMAVVAIWQTGVRFVAKTSPG
jgi:hypothetical protein